MEPPAGAGAAYLSGWDDRVAGLPLPVGASAAYADGWSAADDALDGNV